MTIRRAVIADGSRSVRTVLRRIVESVEWFEVAGEAETGEQAVLLAATAAPDVVVMDADLVTSTGHPASEEILSNHPVPVVLLSTGRDRTRLVNTFRVLQLGAVAVLPKPTVPEQWHIMAETLGQTLEHLGGSASRAPAVEHPPPVGPVPRIHMILVGASTGGPGALAQILAQLDTELPAPLVVVQHIARGFDGALVQWLAAESGLDVALARDGEELRAGSIRFAPSDRHLTVDERRRLLLDSRSAPSQGHRPSIDVLFRSRVGPDARGTAAVLLSGMGADGTAGLGELRAAGALTIAQDQASSALWGMPRIAVESGAAELVMSPTAIGRLLMEAATEVKR